MLILVGKLIVSQWRRACFQVGAYRARSYALFLHCLFVTGHASHQLVPICGCVSSPLLVIQQFWKNRLANMLVNMMDSHKDIVYLYMPGKVDLLLDWSNWPTCMHQPRKIGFPHPAFHPNTVYVRKWQIDPRCTHVHITIDDGDTRTSLQLCSMKLHWYSRMDIPWNGLSWNVLLPKRSASNPGA